jgi:hypothetical protein
VKVCTKDFVLVLDVTPIGDLLTNFLADGIHLDMDRLKKGEVNLGTSM